MMVKMAENIRLVNDVKTLFLQPGHEPGLLLSDNYAAKEFSSKIGVPVFLGNSTSGDLSGISNIINSTPFIADSCNYLENSAQTTQFVGEMSGSLARQIQDNLQSNGAAFNASSSGQSHIKLYDDLKAKFAMRMKSNSTLTSKLVAKAELLSLHPEMMMNQQACLHLPRSDQLLSSSSSTVDSGSLRWLEKGILSNAGIQGHFGTPDVSSGMLTSVPRTNANMISSSHDDPGDHLTTNHMLVYNSVSGHYFTDDRSAMRELNVCNERMANKIIQAHGIPLSKHDKHKNSGELPPGFVLANRNHEFGESQSFKSTEFEDACIGPQSGDDLFDNLGTEDLNQPRQMLVEMLCEESGLFLEIADIIRGLGLTILKGVMETGNDKIWVHFAVEANRDVTRMEIFVSLVNLLEKNAKGGVQPAEGISKNIP